MVLLNPEAPNWLTARTLKLKVVFAASPVSATLVVETLLASALFWKTS
jgi:hypothetical protein